MFNQLLKKLIKTSSGRARFIMAVVGLCIALLLVLSAVQLQSDYSELLHGKTNQDSVANFLVISKQLNSKNVNNATLSQADIDDIKKQPFTEAVGVLTANRFKVSAQSISERIPFYTDMFFESVPDEFIDVQSSDWKWTEQSTYIPMIVPNSFLDMYNFGFATSQNLPQLSQELVKNLPVQLNLQTPNGIVKTYGKVVGFSDRISSVLVPQNCMDWANAHFGTGNNAGAVSRIVIKTKDDGNPALLDYLNQHGLSTDTDKTRFSRYRKIVNVVVVSSWVTGMMMLLFALLVFVLFIQLTIASCKAEIELLITLGTSPKQLRKFLIRQFFPSNIVIIVVVLAILSALQLFVQHMLVEQHIFLSAYLSVYTIAAAILILLVLWLVNNASISKYIKRAACK
jgi:hypothetical protein